jgi:hypothetical protein
MTGLIRTDLPTSRKAELAASAFARQAEHGAKTQLAHSFGVSRPTVYAAASTAEEVLEKHFCEAESGYHPITVNVDGAQLNRAIVAMRAMAPNPLRPIEDMLPFLYPGIQVSYGKVQQVAAGAEQKAAAFNAGEDLSGIDNSALDEMFSQGDPVLAGVDLDSGYLFGLELRASRSGEDWAEFLGDKGAKGRGLNLQVVVKDAAKGIASGVSTAFPSAEQRDDCFHAHYEMGKVWFRLQRLAYATIASEIEAETLFKREETSLQSNRSKRASRAQQLAWARRKCQEAIALHDAFERAMRDAQEAMEFADPQTGELRTTEQMETAIRSAAEEMMALGHKKGSKVGRYIYNRAPGLASHMKALNGEFVTLIAKYGETATQWACLAYRLALDLRHQRRSWDSANQKCRLREAIDKLETTAGPTAQELFADVGALILRRHRASSAIEGFNAALRPHLYVHKGATQGFLELFRAHHNLRTRRWGRHKGTSARESLTGERVEDWLTVLGYPPSTALH